MRAARALRKWQQPRSLINDVRQFLTPLVWKQARQAVPRRRAVPRWDLQPLVSVVMAMTGAAADSQPEKFETARGFYVACHAARKRPGKTREGLQKTLGRIPMRQFRTLAAGVRQEIRTRFATRLRVDGFEPLGGDGSRIECPRTTELEARLGQAGKSDAAPPVWVTAFVPLSTGLLGSWRLGPGTAAEQEHRRRVLGTRSPQALIVCDAAYLGSELVRAILRTNRSFLFRMSSKVHLSPREEATLKHWSEGPVWSWPADAPRQGIAPMAGRLIRVPAEGQVKHDVWLLTDVLDPARRPAATAAKFSRWRWRNEDVFRTYKRTIHKLKLSRRTVRLVHREAALSLLATQILLAHADRALRPETKATAGAPVISPRQVLIEIRREMKGAANRRVRSSHDRLRGCRADDRKQTGPKAFREWPRRKPHKPPKPPLLHTLTGEQKSLLKLHLGAAG